jgi:nucleoside-diphosphate-sugar epimerase
MQQLVDVNCSEKPEHYPVDPSIDHLLVTGGTGFIGGAILAELLATSLWTKTLIMVRAQSLEEGKGRIAESMQRFFPDVSVAGLINIDQIVLGGLEDAGDLVGDRRARKITHVIHSAAVTSFSDNPKIKAVNVDASLNFLRCLSEVARLRRFTNVGTAWCVGMRTSEVVPETALIAEGEHIVPYTQSKLEFERRARQEFPGLSFVSARPSIVVGHTKLGTKPSGSIYWVFRSTFLLGQFTCAYSEKLDVVPVDWVAHAVLRLATIPKPKFDHYHLSTGPRGASTIAQIDAAIASGINQGPHGSAGYRHVTSGDLAKAVRSNRDRLGEANPWLLAHALNIYGKFAQSGTVFDNQNTLVEGIPPPPPFFSYAGLCAATAESTSIAAQMEDDFK